MKTFVHTWWMVRRQLRNLMREPIWIALLLIQPMIWLLLYGQLFSRVPTLRGGASTYVEFLLPGIVVMNAFFGGTWAGKLQNKLPLLFRSKTQSPERLHFFGEIGIGDRSGPAGASNAQGGSSAGAQAFGRDFDVQE